MSESLGFLRRGPISPAEHKTLDHLLAATLIAAPLVLHHPGETAKVVTVLLGGAAGLLAVDINLSRGIIRMLSSSSLVEPWASSRQVRGPAHARRCGRLRS